MSNGDSVIEEWTVDKDQTQKKSGVKGFKKVEVTNTRISKFDVKVLFDDTFKKGVAPGTTSGQLDLDEDVQFVIVKAVSPDEGEAASGDLIYTDRR